MIYLSILLLVIAGIFFTLGYRQRQRAGIPSGRVIYTDTSAWAKVEKTLYDPILRLAGRPDYLVRQGRQIIPVEVKSGKSPQVPFDSHIYQLAAYCLLVKREYGVTPKHGIIHYPMQTYAVDFTKTLEASIRATIREMQAYTSEIPTDRSHHEAKRCQRCGYRYMCDRALRI